MQFEQSVLSPFGLVGQSGRQRLTGLNVIAFLARWVALAATTFVHAVPAQWYVVNALCRCTMRAPCILSTLPKEVPNRTRLIEIVVILAIQGAGRGDRRERSATEPTRGCRLKSREEEAAVRPASQVCKRCKHTYYTVTVLCTT